MIESKLPCIRNHRLVVYLPNKLDRYLCCPRHAPCRIHIRQPVRTNTLARLFALPLLTDLNFRLNRIWGVGQVDLYGDGRVIGTDIGRAFLPSVNVCLDLKVRFFAGARSIPDANGIAETLKYIFESALPPKARKCLPIWEDREVPLEVSIPTSCVVREVCRSVSNARTGEEYEGVCAVVSSVTHLEVHSMHTVRSIDCIHSSHHSCQIS